MSDLTIDNIIIHNRNASEAKAIYDSLFIRKDYDVSLNNKSPKIIDCGAHIGLATIYFKKKFPHAQIIAIEPNPQTLKFLKKNLNANHVEDVEVIWGALSKSSAKTLPLYIDPNSTNPWSWDDSIIKDIWSDRPSRKTKTIVEVPIVHLSKIITSKVNLVKMDIEGAECEVIEEADNKLDLVDSIIIEVHPTPKTPLSYLKKIKTILDKHGFKIREYPVDWAIFINATRL